MQDPVPDLVESIAPGPATLVERHRGDLVRHRSHAMNVAWEHAEVRCNDLASAAPRDLGVACPGWPDSGRSWPRSGQSPDDATTRQHDGATASRASWASGSGQRARSLPRPGPRATVAACPTAPTPTPSAGSIST